MKMGYCKNCGADLKDGAKFCNNCGAKIEITPVGQAPVQEQEQNTLVSEAANYSAEDSQAAAAAADNFTSSPKLQGSSASWGNAAHQPVYGQQGNGFDAGAAAAAGTAAAAGAAASSASEVIPTVPGQKQSNPMAIVSLILGIVSVVIFCCCCALFTLFLVILGVLAGVGAIILAVLSRKSSGGKFSKLAVAGMVTGIIGTLIGLFMFVMILLAKAGGGANGWLRSVLERIREQAEQSGSEDLIQQIDEILNRLGA